MARLNGVQPLDDLLHYGSALPHARALRLAGNLAAAVATLHDARIERLDLSGANVLVDDRLLVSLVDCDSYRLPDVNEGEGDPPVATPDFVPPEVLRDPAAGGTRAHDEFALATLLFHILTGVHPFHGARVGPGRRLLPEELVVEGLWPYGPAAAGRVRPPVHAAPRGVLTDEMWELFRRCFVGGHHRPGVRPGARAWVAALEDAAAVETWVCQQCDHEFFVELTGCPWCRAAERSDPTGCEAAVV
jgi:DNA-binding helix-hairpin-helix protein with protein kinase domain